MHGGEDFSRRRRSSSRGSFSSSLPVQPASLGSSNVGVSRPPPVSTAARAANADTAAAEHRCSNDELPSGTALQSTWVQPVDTKTSTAVRRNDSPAAEVGHVSLADHARNHAAHSGPDALSRHVPVAWQPGIDLLEGMQESTAQDSPTDTRRLSDSAVSGPRSYPLSPTSLAAVSPGPPAQSCDGAAAAAPPPAESSHPAAMRGSLPPPAQMSTSVLHTVAHTELGGWALPPRAPPAAAAVRADEKGDADSKIGAGSTAARPLEKQLSNVDAAMPLSSPGAGSWGCDTVVGMRSFAELQTACGRCAGA